MTDEQHLFRAAIAGTGNADASRIDDLSSATGLERLAFSTLRLAPGDYVTVCFDAGSEAFLYVHSGQGCLQSESTDTTFATGDFIAFRPPSTEQIVSNTGTDSLVCLLGGESTTTVKSSRSEQ